MRWVCKCALIRVLRILLEPHPFRTSGLPDMMASSLAKAYLLLYNGVLTAG